MADELNENAVFGKKKKDVMDSLYEKFSNGLREKEWAEKQKAQNK